MTKARPADVFFLSTPRTLSNLLVKLLSAQPGWENSGYYLHDAYVYGLKQFASTIDADAPPEKRQEYVTKLREGYAKMLAAREVAHNNGNAMFLKSHICQIWEPSILFEATRDGKHASEFTLSDDADDDSAHRRRTNPTMLADALLASFVPVFLVRHPALVVDSWYRTESRAGNPPDIRLTSREASLGFGLARRLYDWYAGLVGRSDAPLGPGDRAFPLVVDADDVLEGDTVARLAAAVGMQPAHILDKWEVRSTEGLVPFHKSYVEGIWGSTGIDTSKSSKFLDLPARYASWRESYGDEVGGYLAKITEEFLPDYNYLKSKKM